MAGRNSGAILRELRAVLTVGTFCGQSDGELLERFLESRDAAAELAFSVLVERHGPMVLGVCRRVLRDPHDADDAFQATFLILARKAPTVRVDGSLGRWLFGVATRVATRARADKMRRRARERPGLDRIDMAVGSSSGDAIDRSETQLIVLQEIARLPERLQAPVLLCDLRGLSDREAAQKLNWPLGTVKSRLSRARQRLRGRLARRGLGPDGLTAALLPTASVHLSQGLINAATSAAIWEVAGRLTTVGIISSSVATLAQGAYRTMYWTRLKFAIVAVLAVAGGSAVVYSQAPGPAPSGAQASADHRSEARHAPKLGPAIDIEMLERAWADAIPRRDLAIIGRVLAEDFQAVDHQGRSFDRSAYLKALGEGSFSQRPIVIQEIDVRLFGDTAVSAVQAQVPNVPRPIKTTHVYIKHRDQWRCVAAHECQAISGSGAITSAGPTELNDKVELHERRLKPKRGSFLNLAKGTFAPPAWDRFFVRANFKCRVEKVHVAPGEPVKKGDPLLELHSIDLARAKFDYDTKRIDVDRETKRLEWTKRIHAKGYASDLLLAGEQDHMRRARFELQQATAALRSLGLDDVAIEHVALEKDEDKPRMMVRSPADGTIERVGAVEGSYYDANSDLVSVRAAPAGKPAEH